MVTVVDSLSEKGRPKIMRLVTNAKGCLVSYTFVNMFLLLVFMQVLICRLIDRPLRPTMPKGFYNETQILSWVCSFCLCMMVCDLFHEIDFLSLLLLNHIGR